jgi:predicted RNA binding protein YcfA (HicA-like mRNA interferase family)
MTKIQKKVEKFLKNPTSCKFRDIKAILLYVGFEEIQAKGSHVKFKHIHMQADLIIPVHNNDCKDFYKKNVKSVLEKVMDT